MMLNPDTLLCILFFSPSSLSLSLSLFWVNGAHVRSLTLPKAWELPGGSVGRPPQSIPSLGHRSSERPVDLKTRSSRLSHEPLNQSSSEYRNTFGTQGVLPGYHTFCNEQAHHSMSSWCLPSQFFLQEMYSCGPVVYSPRRPDSGVCPSPQSHPDLFQHRCVAHQSVRMVPDLPKDPRLWLYFWFCPCLRLPCVHFCCLSALRARSGRNRLWTSFCSGSMTGPCWLWSLPRPSSSSTFSNDYC